MKKTNTFTNIAMFVLFAAMLVYLGVYLFRSTQQSYATAPAVLVTVSESGQASGIVVREEQVIESVLEMDLHTTAVNLVNSVVAQAEAGFEAIMNK